MWSSCGNHDTFFSEFQDFLVSVKLKRTLYLCMFVFHIGFSGTSPCLCLSPCCHGRHMHYCYCEVYYEIKCEHYINSFCQKCIRRYTGVSVRFIFVWWCAFSFFAKLSASINMLLVFIFQSIWWILRFALCCIICWQQQPDQQQVTFNIISVQQSKPNKWMFLGQNKHTDHQIWYGFLFLTLFCILKRIKITLKLT